MGVDHNFCDMQVQRKKTNTLNTLFYSQVIHLFCLLVLAVASPVPDPKADPHLLAAVPYVFPTSNCKTLMEVRTSQTCAPTYENVCSKQTVYTNKLVYEKVCKEVVTTMPCKPPTVHIVPPHTGLVKRDADAEPPLLFTSTYYATPQIALNSPAAVYPPNCQATKEHCSHIPTMKRVPVEVDHCHIVSKVACKNVTYEIPKAKCEPSLTNPMFRCPTGFVVKTGTKSRCINIPTVEACKIQPCQGLPNDFPGIDPETGEL